MKKFLLVTLLFSSACSLKNPFNFSTDYREYPIAVDCDKPSEVNLTFQKEGMPTIHIDQNNLDNKIIKGEKGEDRSVCIFPELSLLHFCQYRGADEVAPYWVSAYGRINTVKCKEVLK
jgi:hypothetical protein